MMRRYKIYKSDPQIDEKIINELQEFDSVMNKVKEYKQSRTLKNNTWISLTSFALVISFIACFLLINKATDPVISDVQEQVSPELNNEREQNITTESADPKQKNKHFEEYSDKGSSEKQQEQNRYLDDKDTAKSFSDTRIKNSNSSGGDEPVFIEAEPVNGFEHLYSYFDKSIANDSIIVESTTIIACFTINNSGGVDNVFLRKHTGSKIDTIALELVRNMPKWKAATINGKAISTDLSIPITFNPHSK